jgi:nicotinamide-nucleotide amidase
LGKVRLRLSAKGYDENWVRETLDCKVGELKALVSDILYGEEDGATLEVSLCKRFTALNLTLATAESFTGGSLAALLCSVPGASAYFTGSVVSYATAVKRDVLDVGQDLIDAHSVVSAEVACAMADGVKKLMNTDFAVATTGNAGPDKGESDSPVGKVFLAISGPDGTQAYSYEFGGHRDRVIQRSLNKILELLWNKISPE